MSNKCYYNCGNKNTPKSLFGCETCTTQVLRRNGLQDDICWSYYGPLPDCCCQTCKRQMDLLNCRRNCINFREPCVSSTNCGPPATLPLQGLCCKIFPQVPENNTCCPPCPVCGTCIPCIFQQKYTVDKNCQKMERKIIKECKSAGSLNLSLTVDCTTVSTSSDDLRPCGAGEMTMDDCPYQACRRGALRQPGCEKKNKNVKQEVHFVACRNSRNENMCGVCRSTEDLIFHDAGENGSRSSRGCISKPPIIFSQIELQYCCCNNSKFSENDKKIYTRTQNVSTDEAVDKKEAREKGSVSEDSEADQIKLEGNGRVEEDFCNCSSENEEQTPDEDMALKPKYLKEKQTSRSNMNYVGEDFSLSKSRYSKYDYDSDKIQNYETDFDCDSDDEYEENDEDNRLSYSKSYTKKCRDSKFPPRAESTDSDDVPYCFRTSKKHERKAKKKQKIEDNYKQKRSKTRANQGFESYGSFCRCDEEYTGKTGYAANDDKYENGTYSNKRCCSLVLSCDSSIPSDVDQKEISSNASLYYDR